MPGSELPELDEGVLGLGDLDADHVTRSVALAERDRERVVARLDDDRVEHVAGFDPARVRDPDGDRTPVDDGFEHSAGMSWTSSWPGCGTVSSPFAAGDRIDRGSDRRVLAWSLVLGATPDGSWSAGLPLRERLGLPPAARAGEEDEAHSE